MARILRYWFLPFQCIQPIFFQIPFPLFRQRGIVNTNIKVFGVIKGSVHEVWSRSEHSFACLACCLELYLTNFYCPSSLNIFQLLFPLCWQWGTADADIKAPSDENLELSKAVLFKSGMFDNVTKKKRIYFQGRVEERKTVQTVMK